MTPFWIFLEKKIPCFKFVFLLFKILFIHVRMYIMKVKFKLTDFFLHKIKLPSQYTYRKVYNKTYKKDNLIVGYVG